MSTESVQLKASLVRARHSIANKLQQLHMQRINQDKRNEVKYSPITNSINQLVATNDAILAHNDSQPQIDNQHVDIYDRIDPDELINMDIDNRVNEYLAEEQPEPAYITPADELLHYNSDGDDAETVEMDSILPMQNNRENMLNSSEQARREVNNAKGERHAQRSRTLKQIRSAKLPYASRRKIIMNQTLKKDKTSIPANELEAILSQYPVDTDAIDTSLPESDSEVTTHSKKANKRRHESKTEKKSSSGKKKSIVLSLEDYDKKGNYNGLAPKRRKITAPAKILHRNGKLRNMSSKRKIIISPEDYDEKGNYIGLAPKRRKIAVKSKKLIKKMKLFRDAMTLHQSARIIDKSNSNFSAGKGLEKDFIPYNSNIVYEYYDDPNELCDRLRLLVASKQAGNSNHDQEINSIIEELRESNFIE